MKSIADIVESLRDATGLDPLRLILFGTFVATAIGMILHRSGGRPIRRGVTVWRTTIGHSIVEELRVFEGSGPVERSWGWFRVEGGEAVLVGRMRNADNHRIRTFMPYVVTIDLTSGSPTIEWRVPVASLLFPLLFIGIPTASTVFDDGGAPFFVPVIAFLFIAAATAFNHHLQSHQYLIGITRIRECDDIV